MTVTVTVTARTGTAETIRVERMLLVDRLSALSEEDWRRPSLCEGWSLTHVVAHLVTPFLISPPSMAVAVLRHGSFSRAMDATARRIADRCDGRALLEVLQHNAASTFRPPGLPLAAPLVDVVAHSADIRWALGDAVEDWGPPARLLAALDFLTSCRAAAGFVPPDRLRGLRLSADDQDWSWGSGPVVRGPSLVLAMSVLGRTRALSEVTGDGAAVLAER